MNDSAEERVAWREKPGILPDDPMSEAGRKALAYHFARLLKQESGARTGEDDEAIHDMRVATRRMRSTLQIFADFYDGAPVKRWRKMLSKIADGLGNVRDLDVLRQKAKKYADKLPEHQRESITLLMDRWKSQADQARLDLIVLLDSERYKDFLDEFTDFVNTPEKYADFPQDEPIPYLVRHVVPSILYQHYALVRAYETELEDASLDMLHELRIEAKRLRYALESFEEALGSEAKTVIEASKALQDHLGDLQDARVASLVINDYIKTSSEEESLAGVAHYLASREEEKQRLLGEVSKMWKTFTQPEIRRSLALAVSAL